MCISSHLEDRLSPFIFYLSFFIFYLVFPFTVKYFESYTESIDKVLCKIRSFIEFQNYHLAVLNVTSGSNLSHFRNIYFDLFQLSWLLQEWSVHLRLSEAFRLFGQVAGKNNFHRKTKQQPPQQQQNHWSPIWILVTKYWGSPHLTLWKKWEYESVVLVS